MSPIEGQNLPQPSNAVQNGFPLSQLIEFMVQKTYHDLTVLAELIHRKSDSERKVEIYQFATRTKQLFVRLLALVKWMNTASKVEKCAKITSLLQNQQMIFVDTADALYRMAKETLVRARLPCFSLPAAVDVLTTGTYPRLPHCIKEKIVPPESLAPIEKKKVLSKLTQVIEYRIVTSDLPACMCKPILDSGRVKFLVNHEFEVTLTLMGDMANLPWRLLKIDILVEDHENGSSSFLVHPKQVDFLREVIQMRLLESEQPLHDLYNCLHYFCQSLQLEVLHYQAMTLIRERFGDHMKVEEYTAGRSLTISYWRLTDHSKPKGKPYHQGFKLNIHVDDKKFGKPLQITHFPQIMGVDGVKCLKQINVACLSLEKVWTHTIQIRGTVKLKELKRELEMFMQLKCEMTSVPPMISIQLVPPLKEIVAISVDDLKGTFVVNLPSSVSSFESSLAESLNSDKKDLRHIIYDIRQHITMKNYKRLIESSPMTLLNYSAFSLTSTDPKNTHVVKLNNVTKNKLVIKYEKDAIRFYLLGDEKSRNDVNNRNNNILKEVHPEFIEKWIAIHSEERSSMDCVKYSPASNLYSGNVTRFGELAKELLFVHTYSEDMLCFTELSEELLRHRISNTRYLPDPTGVGLTLTLLSFPEVEGIGNDVKKWLKATVLSVTFRLMRRERVHWYVEIIFTASPIKSKDGLHHLTFSYEIRDSEKVVASFIDDWSKVCHLYQAVLPFASIYNNSSLKQSILPTVEVVTYTFNKIVLSYGPGNAFCVDLFYSPKSKSFQLLFSTCVPSPISNSHSAIFSYLEHFFNENKSLCGLCKIFEDTCSIWSSISKLNTSPITWLKKSSPVPIQNFTIIPQSPFQVKLVFQSLFCIEVISGSNSFTIKDGSYSRNGVDVFAPIPGFQAFLESFTNEIQSMKVHIKEEDVQSSPMGVEQMDFMSSGMNFLNNNSPLTHKLTASSPAQMLMYSSSNNSPSTMFTQSPANQNVVTCRTALSVGGIQVMSAEFFNKLVSQTPGSPGSPLERYLGAAFFKRHLQILFASDKNFTLLTTAEPTCVTAKCEMLNLNLKFSLTNSKLQLRIISIQDPMELWQQDDLPSLEKYFDLKVAIFPFKPLRLEGFCNLLKLEFHVLKDFVQILKLEMNPEKNLNWHVQLLLTMPHGTGLEYSIGSCALLVSRKLVFVLKFTKNTLGSEATIQPASSIVAAFCYDPNSNYIQLVECQKNANTNISSLVKRFNEYSIKTNECSLFSCILELINNLQFLN